MRRLLFTLAITCLSALAVAQTPTLVQDANLPNSGDSGGDTWTGAGCTATSNRYCAALPEPAAATGNIVFVGVWSGNTSAGTVTDDKSDTCTLRDSKEDGSDNFIEVWSCSVTAGARVFSYAPSGTGGYISMHLTEVYNASTYDTSNCDTTATASTSIAAGSITPGASGDVLWQFAGNSGIPKVLTTDFAASTQTNFAAVMETASINDGIAAEIGIYSSTSAINPTMTGQSEKWDSCVIAFKAGSAGGAPSSSFHIVHMLHEQQPTSVSSPQKVQFPATGNLIVVSAIGTTTAGSISSTPSNTWAYTGSTCSNSSISQIAYAANASVSGTMSISIPFTGTNNGGTWMVMDFTGAAAAPFDNDSGCLSGDQSTESSNLTICSSCFSPGHANDVVVGNMGVNNCTQTAVSTTPSGGLFDSAVYNGNAIDGPQNVDQNNGWFHLYPASTASETVTMTQACTQAAAEWAGRLAAFQPAGASGVRHRAWVIQ